jgi:Zn-dependent protease/CBS domain-containing protein
VVSANLEVARVWGIGIRIHASWLLVFGLVAWSLAGGYFPEEYPGWSALAYWSLGAVTSLLFFASVLVHELAHSWVALRHGLPIRSITLFVFGGVAHVGREPADPGVELRIALAGPLTSLALAGLFGGAWLLVRGEPLAAAPAIWLARINGIVAVFNLVPGFPLDGGRVLRALLWRWTGSFQRATQTAAFAGQAIAAGFIALGALSALGGNVLGGVWMVLIGWFLQNAAAATSSQAGLRELLRGVKVSQAMARDCPQVPGDRTLDRLVQDQVLGAGRRCFLVTEDGRLRGLLTLHEVKAVPRERWSGTRVEEVMTPLERLAAVGPDDDLFGALERMDDADVAQLPVVTGGELVGLIGREQILRYIRARAELGV